jgi:hypothetical protein
MSKKTQTTANSRETKTRRQTCTRAVNRILRTTGAIITRATTRATNYQLKTNNYQYNNNNKNKRQFYTNYNNDKVFYQSSFSKKRHKHQESKK